MKHLLLNILIHLIFSNDLLLLSLYALMLCKFYSIHMHYIFSIFYTVVEMLWDFRKFY